MRGLVQHGVPPGRRQLRFGVRVLHRRRLSSRPLRAAGLVAALLAVAGTAAADIFHYTDAEGVMHFTNKPAGDARYRLYMKSRDGARRHRDAALVGPVRMKINGNGIGPTGAASSLSNRRDDRRKSAAVVPVPV